VRNALPWIDEFIESVHAQTYPAGLYLAEDWSDDGTADYLRGRPDLYTRMVRNRKRAGWPGGLNRAASLAFEDGCDAVFTASADDRLHPECIRVCVKALKGRDFVVPCAQQFGEANHIQRSMPDQTLDDLAQWPLLIDKGLFPRRLWETVGGYSIEAMVPGSWGCAEDWEFWIKVWKAGLTRYAVTTQPLYFVRVHPGRLSDSRERFHARSVERIKAMHPDLPWSPTSTAWPPAHRIVRRIELEEEKADD
jgi:GT2 family glycosyltransferase